MPGGVYLKHGREARDTIASIKDLGGLAVADHLFYNSGLGEYLTENPDILRQIDAIEIFNGEAELWIPGLTLQGANAAAEEFYNIVRDAFPHLGSVVTSDGHSLYEIGSSYMEIPKPDLTNSETLVESLKDALRIKRSNNDEERSRVICRIGALEHLARLAWHKTLDKLRGSPEFKNLFEMNGQESPEYTWI